MSFAVSSFTPRQAARACHVAPFPGMMFQQQKCRFAGAGRSFLEAAETLTVLALRREKLTAGALIPGWLVEGKVSQQGWDCCRCAAAPPHGTSLAGTAAGALHASQSQCQLIEFANDPSSQNPSRAAPTVFALAIKSQAKNAMCCHLTFRCQRN